MIQHNILLDTLRTNKIKSNQMYWNFINDLKPYFWSSLMYRLISYNNKHHNNCLSTLLKLIQSRHNKNKITQKSTVTPESKPTKVIQESKPTKVIQETKPPKVTQESKPTKVIQESKPTKVIQESKPIKVIQESKPPKVTQESTQTKVIQESKPPKVTQEIKPTNEAIVNNKISTDKPKPMFKGKMPHSSINNFKEYLKNKLNIDSSKSIPRPQFNTLCEEYNFDKDKYNSSQPWFEYIKHNMII